MADGAANCSMADHPSRCEPLLPAQSKAEHWGETSSSSASELIGCCDPLLGGAEEEASSRALGCVDDDRGDGNRLDDRDGADARSRARWQQKGEMQVGACRNLPFAIFFLMQLLAIVGFAATFVVQHWPWWHGGYATPTENKDGDDEDESDSDTGLPPIEGHNFKFPQDWIGLVLFFACIACLTLILSIILFVIFSECTAKAIRASLIVAPTTVLLVGIHRSSIVLIIAASLCLYWAKVNWRRIPLAAVNLHWATVALNDYMAIVMVASGAMLACFTWVLTWFMAVTEVSSRFDLFMENGQPVYWMLSLLCLSMFWTWQTIAYTLHTTISGIVGRWCIDPPHEDGSRTTTVLRSLGHSITHAFGSICFGSLVIASVETVDYTIREIRRNNTHRSNMCCCMLQFCFIRLDWIAQYANKWAFAYIGMYGYGFVGASKVSFRILNANNCWSTLASNHSMDKIIATLSISNATIAAVCGVMINRSFPTWLHAFSSPLYKHEERVLEDIAFWLAFLCAFLLSSILSRTILSAVDTVIVGLVESPDDMQRNQPELFHKFKQEWNESPEHGDVFHHAATNGYAQMNAEDAYA